MASYGLTCNASYTNNDGLLELGVHLTDSEGLDVSVQGSSKDAYDLVESLAADLWSKIAEQSTDLADEEYDDELDEIQRLKDENEKLLSRIEQLQKQVKESKSSFNFNTGVYIDDLMSKPKSAPKKPKVSFDDFEALLDEITKTYSMPTRRDCALRSKDKYVPRTYKTLKL